MTDYWTAIQERLHEESGLRYPLNTMTRILQTYFNHILNKFSEDNREMVDQGFLITTSGYFLDIRGAEMGLPRHEGTYATGQVTFTLIREIKQEQESTPLPEVIDDGETFDFVPDAVQVLMNKLNTEREETDSPTKIDIRIAKNAETFGKGLRLKSETGFEYVLEETVTIPAGSSIGTGRIKAVESGQRYNTEANTITTIVDNGYNNGNYMVTNAADIVDGVDGEDDDSYRKRLLNNISTNISVNFLKRQGIIIYSKKSLKNNIRVNMTSFNPYLNDEYCLIPPDDELLDYVTNEVIGDYCFVVYLKGW